MKPNSRVPPIQTAREVVSSPVTYFAVNPRTAGGLSHLRTAGGGGTYVPPGLLENYATHRQAENSTR